MAVKCRPKLAVWKFSSCDGCQLSLLDLEDELLALAGAVEIAYFLEASSARMEGPYDISLVEGSVSTREEMERIQQVRAESKLLVTIGACATAGGIQALRNYRSLDELIKVVYAHPQYIDSLERVRPVAELVPVDFELRGCPINRHQLLELLSAMLNGRRPNIPTYSQCMECKQAGTVCVMVARGEPCIGPLVQAGCGNLCPSCNRPCYGCFGPVQGANTRSLADWLSGRQGRAGAELRRLFHGFTAAAEAFGEEGERHE